MKKFIALLLSVLMCLCMIPAVTAENAEKELMTPAEREARIASLLDYNARLNEMTAAYGLKDAKKNADDPFANARIIVKSSHELDYSGSVAHVNGYNDLHVIQYSTPAEAKAAMEKYESLSYVQYAEPDAIVQICATPGDYNYVSWGYGEDYVNAQDFNAWILTTVDSVDDLPEIIIAVIDTGADSDHPMIADRLVPGYDFENNDSNPEDDHGHGTHVSGTIIDGTLPNVKVMALKALDADGYGDEAKIANAMEYAVLQGCSGANMSLSGPCTEAKHARYEEAVELGYEYNCVFCVAAGNNGSEAGDRCPANVEGCITVAAHDSSDAYPYFTNTGDCVDITAPGDNINSARMGGGYVTMDGTSMATPHVAAVVGMLKTVNPDMSVEETTNIIKYNARPPRLTGGGAGMLCVTNMLKFYELNGEGSYMPFDSEGSYPWVMNGDFAESGNAGVDNTTSVLSATAELKPYQMISFEYKVSSQQNGDYLKFKVGGDEVFSVSGEHDWQTYSYIVPGNGQKTFSWEFVKDAAGANGQDKAFIRNVVISDTISTVFNFGNTCVGFDNDANYPWVIDGDSIKSGNAGVNSSASTITASVELQEGVSICFDYKVSAQTGDELIFTINGETLLNTSSQANFTTFEYQVPADGIYNITFSFVKDATGASGSDCAWLKNFAIGHTLTSALNVPGGNLHFVTGGNYPWVAVDDYAKSGNEGYASTSSEVTLTIELNAGDTISFDYKVSSEANYDKFFFYANNTKMFEFSGTVAWTHYTYTATSNMTYTFKWTYTKDGSVDRNDDCAYLDNVEVISSISGILGDVNNDGSVNVQDAMLVMRHAMGIGSNLDLSLADVNGDGTVNAADAAYIMRMAMGIQD